MCAYYVYRPWLYCQCIIHQTLGTWHTDTKVCGSYSYDYLQKPKMNINIICKHKYKHKHKHNINKIIIGAYEPPIVQCSPDNNTLSKLYVYS